MYVNSGTQEADLGERAREVRLTRGDPMLQLVWTDDGLNASGPESRVIAGGNGKSAQRSSTHTTLQTYSESKSRDWN